MDAPFSRSKQIAPEEQDDDDETLTFESHPRIADSDRPTPPGAASPTLRAALADAIPSDVESRPRRSNKGRVGTASQPMPPPQPWPPPLTDEPSQPVASSPRALIPSTAYAAGSVIVDKYRLEREIGSGGMGSVWLAHNLTLDIDVAIKLIRRDRTTVEAKGRLLQEARAAARIGHPSIVRIHDFGETPEGDPFIVMELLNGEPLSSLLARKRHLLPSLAVRTLLPVASALMAAHAKGIVHRDLKPDNILLVTNEVDAVVPKIVDFGIARLIGADIDARFTLAGEVLGSPDYMSPEQARGDEEVGEATDVWAFTVILYEAITGKRPFVGVNYNALLAHIITVEPMPFTQLGIDDEELWLIVARGLAKDVSKRWRTMREMGKALATWAMARGFGEDVAGTALGKHWLSGGRRRTLSVRPPGAQLPPLLAPPPQQQPSDRLQPPRAPAISPPALLRSSSGAVLSARGVETMRTQAGPVTRSTVGRALARWQSALAVVLVALIGILGWALLRAPPVPASGVLAMPASEKKQAPSAEILPVAEMPVRPPQPPPLEPTAPAPDLAPGKAQGATPGAPAGPASAKAMSTRPVGVRHRPRSAPTPVAPPVPRRINF